jgi:hypothetical protein
MNATRPGAVGAMAILAAETAVSAQIAYAASARSINEDVDRALRTLYAAQPKARDLVQRKGTPLRLHPESAAETTHSVGPYHPRVDVLDQGGPLGMRRSGRGMERILERRFS